MERTNKRITQRDRDIVRFVESNGAITTSMCSRMFIPDANNGNRIALRRLNKLVDNKYLRVGKADNNENMYYIDKKLSYHDLLINKVYIELVRCGVKIINFDKKRTWMNNAFHSDIFIQCDYGDDYYFFFWEICWTHKDIPIQYYEELCKSEEGLKIINYKGYIPKLIVMDDSSHEFKSDVLKIIKVDYNLSNLPLIFI